MSKLNTNTNKQIENDKIEIKKTFFYPTQFAFEY